MFILSLLVIIALIAVDQVTKHLAVNLLQPAGTVNVIPDILNFTYVENRGAAFGVLSNARWVFISATIIIMIMMLYMLCKGEFKHFIGKTAALLIISGGIGNLIDRLSIGYVIDFIDVSPLFNFAVFNFADCCVTVGSVLLILNILFFYDEKGTDNKKKLTEPDGTSETA